MTPPDNIPDEEISPDPLAEPPQDENYFANDERVARAASLKKIRQLALGAGAFVVALITLVIFSLQPPKGNIMYGVCSVLLEQIVDYPTTLEHLYVEQFPNVVRIYFNQMDAFGQRTRDMIECSADRKYFPKLRFDRVLLNRQQLDKEIIGQYNRTIDVVIAAKPDLTLPESMY